MLLVMKSLIKWHTCPWQCPWWGRGQKSQTYEEREIPDFCIISICSSDEEHQSSDEDRVRQRASSFQHQSRVWQLALCTEHFKNAMFVSWPSNDLSSLDTNIPADVIPVNSGHEVNWNEIHLKTLLHMWLEGWLSSCQASTWKHGFNQETIFCFLPRNVS